MMVNLHTTGNLISREERVKLNENWQLLTQRFSHFQRHLNLLAGEDVEGIITNINERIAETDTALQQIETDLIEVNGAANNANAKAELAQTAADIAEQITALAQEKIDFIETHEEDIEFFTSMQNNLQAQVDQLVISGDSSPEAAQARVGTDGTQHNTLKARLDSEIGQVTTQLVENDEKINTLMRRPNAIYFDNVKGEYMNLDMFWNQLRNGKKYTVEFNQYAVSPSSLGTKMDDNVGLVCEPSTNVYRGRNDYENIGLFMAIDVNAYVDENDDYHVTAMKGDGRFKADGSNGDVYVMAMTGYIKRQSDDETWSISYSDTPHPGYEILDEAVKPNGSIRPYLLHAKYVAGRGLDGKLASISGVAPEYLNMSHNGQITQFAQKGVQYSGKTSHDDFYTTLMLLLKYATTDSQSVMTGCASYSLQYDAAQYETDTTRFIVTNAQADTLLLGSCVSIGDYNGNTKTSDRAQAIVFNVANRVKIIDKIRLPNDKTAIVLDTVTNFTTTVTSTITTYPWISGACDNVLGTDGSPFNNKSNKEPFIINGIEVMVGGYEIIQNLIIENDNSVEGAYEMKVYANYDCKTFATSPTTNYDLIANNLAQTNNAWRYISKVAIDNNHPSVLIPSEANGTSTTGFADGVYTNAPSNGYRARLSLGYLSSGALAGLRCLHAYNDLSYSSWHFLGRLSATGRSRRRAQG